MNEQKHTFALYYPASFDRVGQLIVTDAPVVHRISRVLRLRVGESLQLFNDVCQVTAIVEEVDERRVRLRLGEATQLVALSPAITVLLAVLKHGALEDAISSLTQCGVQYIRLYTSDRVQRAWGGVKEHERMMRVMIAAAEQSKQLILPILHDPQFLLDVLDQPGARLWCEFGETSFIDVAHQAIKKGEPITLLVGPEADFSIREKELVKTKGFVAGRLTQSILRAEQAAFLAAGIIRSIT